MDSLFALETEVLQKSHAAKQQRNGVSGLKFKNQENISVSSKSASTTRVMQTVDDSSDLKKSRAMLEAKTMFYEKMQNSKGIGSDGSKRYLVDFESKILEDTTKVEQLKQKGEIVCEELEEVFAPVHYQHLREDEARELGVGYFEFSLDEDTRQNQLDMLKELHKETKGKQKTKEQEAKRRQIAIQERLNKIRAKKNLPLVEPNCSTEDRADNDKDYDNKESVSELHQNRAEHKANALNHNREWDSKKRTLAEVIDAKIKKAKEERDPDFAPPQIYQESTSYSSTSSYSNSIRNIPGTGSFVSSTGNAMKSIESMYDNGPKNLKSGLCLPREGQIAGLVIGDSIQKRVISENISNYVFVRGFGGAKAKDICERLSFTPVRKIKHVIFTIGLNDALACSHDDLEFRVYFKKSIDLVHQKFNPDVLQIGTITPTRGDLSHVNSYIDRINALIKELFNELSFQDTNMQLLDVHAAFQLAISPICQDGVHPSTEGVMVLVQCYRQQFEASGIEINWDQEVTVRQPPEKEKRKL
ncbi:uncharacterized protein LOC134855271 [Symsagittifera roscoffensis]|uniref:uncharacterized protein LOC134855271 n=1 Tax=Symsagittifera roscoffensis TaxID=84072 RepID=UPI00307B8488